MRSRWPNLEQRLGETGHLEGLAHGDPRSTCCGSNDLIWSYLVNNYLKGQGAACSSTCSTGTSMPPTWPAARHGVYLRNCYRDNNLTKGEMVMAGKKLSPSRT